MYRPKSGNSAISLILAAAVIVLACPRSAGEAFAQYVYDNGGRRDPFVPLAGLVDKAGKSALEDVTSIDDISFQGIVVSPAGAEAAVINNEILKKGEKIGAVSVEDVGESEVTVIVNGKEYKLKLYE